MISSSSSSSSGSNSSSSSNISIGPDTDRGCRTRLNAKLVWIELIWRTTSYHNYVCVSNTNNNNA